MGACALALPHVVNKVGGPVVLEPSFLEWFHDTIFSKDQLLLLPPWLCEPMEGECGQKGLLFPRAKWN